MCHQKKWFPSLSGKTSIRTGTVAKAFFWVIYVFPSLSGKTSIRTKSQQSGCVLILDEVSIPFREDLYSDATSRHLRTITMTHSFHPFQGRPLFGRGSGHRGAGGRNQVFPSLSGKTSIRTRRKAQRHQNSFSHVSIPFREDLYSDI